MYCVNEWLISVSKNKFFIPYTTERHFRDAQADQNTICILLRCRIHCYRRIHGLRGKCFRSWTRLRGYKCSGLRPLKLIRELRVLARNPNHKQPPKTVPKNSETTREKRMRSKKEFRYSTRSARALPRGFWFKYETRDSGVGGGGES